MSLASLAIRQIPLEDLVEQDLVTLPLNEAILRELAYKISGRAIQDQERFIAYYQQVGWQEFKEDLLFLLQHDGKPLDYPDLSLYWQRHYLLAIAQVTRDESGESRKEDLTVSYFERLEDVIFTILNLFIEKGIRSDEHLPIQVTTIPSSLADIYDLVIDEKQDAIDDLYRILETEGVIYIRGPLDNTSLYPLWSNDEAAIILSPDRQHLSIVGIFIDDSLEDVDPSFGYSQDPYVLYFSGNDVQRILAILILNP